MADETMGGEQQSTAAAGASASSHKDAPATKYGGHDEAGKPVDVPKQPNPSDPGNTGTTPGSNADVG
jgi:hypothetical protein